MDADRQLNHYVYKECRHHKQLFNSATFEHRLWIEYFDIIYRIYRYSE